MARRAHVAVALRSEDVDDVGYGCPKSIHTRIPGSLARVMPRAVRARRAARLCRSGGSLTAPPLPQQPRLPGEKTARGSADARTGRGRRRVPPHSSAVQQLVRKQQPLSVPDATLAPSLLLLVVPAGAVGERVLEQRAALERLADERVCRALPAAQPFHRAAAQRAREDRRRLRHGHAGDVAARSEPGALGEEVAEKRRTPGI